MNPLQKYIAKAEVSLAMTKERAVLIQKEKEKGRMASNYRHTTCLSLVWKLLNGTIDDGM